MIFSLLTKTLILLPRLPKNRARFPSSEERLSSISLPLIMSVANANVSDNSPPRVSDDAPLNAEEITPLNRGDDVPSNVDDSAHSNTSETIRPKSKASSNGSTRSGCPEREFRFEVRLKPLNYSAENDSDRIQVDGVCEQISGEPGGGKAHGRVEVVVTDDLEENTTSFRIIALLEFTEESLLCNGMLKETSHCATRTVDFKLAMNQSSNDSDQRATPWQAVRRGWNWARNYRSRRFIRENGAIAVVIVNLKTPLKCDD